MKPDAEKYYNPDPDYLRILVEEAGLSQIKCAKAIGISARLLRRYLRTPPVRDYLKAPYPVQYALEQLVHPASSRAR